MMYGPTRRPEYRAAWWLPGAHAQTLWGKLVRSQPPAPVRLERWSTPDGDFLDLQRIAAPAGAPDTPPHLLLLHGLEGTIRSHYAQALLHAAARRGWSADLLVWRSCGSEPNRARRFYHSGDTGDLALVAERLVSENPGRKLGIAGVSLGGNVLLKFLGERGPALPGSLVGAVAVSVPFDLARGSDHFNRGFSRMYQRYFLESLRRKVLAKRDRYPDFPAPERIAALRTLRDFDDLLTAPLHGFADASDYYARSSAIHFLVGIRVPTLLLNARDDPFLPRCVLDDVSRIAAANPLLTVEFPARGGHAGFVGGRNPFRPVYYLEHRVIGFLDRRFAEASSSG